MQNQLLGLQSNLPRSPLGHRCPSNLDGLSNGLAELEDDVVPKWPRNRVGLEGWSRAEAMNAKVSIEACTPLVITAVASDGAKRFACS